MTTEKERLALEAIHNEIRKAHRRIDNLEKRQKAALLKLDPPTKCNSQTNYYLVALGNQCWHLCGILRLGEITSDDADLFIAATKFNQAAACEAQKKLNLNSRAIEYRAKLLVQAIAFIKAYSYCKFVVANQEEFLQLAIESCAHYHWCMDDLPYFN